MGINTESMNSNGVINMHFLQIMIDSAGASCGSSVPAATNIINYYGVDVNEYGIDLNSNGINVN
jgi:hypothetical protein